MKGKFFKMVDYIKQYPYIIFQGLNGKYEYGYNLETKEWKGVRGTIKVPPFKKIFDSNELTWDFQEFLIEFSKFFDMYYPYKNTIVGIPAYKLFYLKKYFYSKNMYSFLEKNKDKKYYDDTDFVNDFTEFFAKKNDFIIPHWVFKRARGTCGNKIFDFIEKYQDNPKAKNLFNKIFSSTGYFYNSFTDIILTQIDEYITLCKGLNVPMETGDFFRNYDKVLKIKESRERKTEEKIFKKSQEERNLFFENEEYITIIPTTYQEIQKEGENLNNCLGGYEWNTYLSKGKRKVVFVRRKDNPDKSYIACDINIFGFICQFLKGNNQEIKPTKDEENIFDFKEKYQEYLHSIWNEED